MQTTLGRAQQASCRRVLDAKPRPFTRLAVPSSRGQLAIAGAAKTNSWAAWESSLSQWSSSHKALPPKSPEDIKALAAAVKSAAASYKPKHAVTPAAAQAVAAAAPIDLDYLDDLPDLPRTLHGRLELVSKVLLQAHLGDAGLEPSIIEFTTTDIAAALQVAGVIVEGKKGARTAHLAMVACETERQMTWSRLEGLMCHWGVSSKAGGSWELPPRGFKTIPSDTRDAGGAWESRFEKHPLVGPDVSNEVMYTLLVSVPLEGALEKGGGLVYVLKSSGEGANTRWLKDTKTKKDFWLDLHGLKKVA